MIGENKIQYIAHYTQQTTLSLTNWSEDSHVGLALPLSGSGVDPKADMLTDTPGPASSHDSNLTSICYCGSSF